jgi:hypothetical protein
VSLRNVQCLSFNDLREQRSPSMVSGILAHLKLNLCPCGDQSFRAGGE